MAPFWLSRKFWFAVWGVILTIVLYYVDVPKEIIAAVDALVAVLIASIAYEDAARNSQ